MKQTRLSHSRKLLRNALVCALTLATVFVFTVLATPVSALSEGDTIYVSAGEYTISSASACFKDETNAIIMDDSENSLFNMTYDEQSGAYSVEIPANAYKVYFLVSCEGLGGVPEHGDSPMTLSECSGNAYDLVTGTWYTFGSSPSETLPEETTADTSAETDRVGYSDEPGNNTQTITPSGKVGTTVSSDEIVSVDLSWQAMEFIYTPASQGTWNPDTHAYEGGNEASWSSTTNQISVTNHSNVGITAAFDFQSAENLDLEGEFHDGSNQTVTSVDLESAADSTDGAGTPTTQNVTFHITGGSISADTDALGTITVTITKKQ